MNELLIHTARELTDDEFGGHGNRWGVFDNYVSALIGRWLGIAVEKSEVPSSVPSSHRHDVEYLFVW